MECSLTTTDLPHGAPAFWVIIFTQRSPCSVLAIQSVVVGVATSASPEGLSDTKNSHHAPDLLNQSALSQGPQVIHRHAEV